MTTPEFFMEIEKKTFSPFACLTSASKGREKPEESSPVRTAYQRDRDRIIHSKSFRRLMHKTQVFLSPVDEHYRTRMTHTLEVTQIARIIASALRLNEDLTEAIALGHDLGHTPFGDRARARSRTHSFRTRGRRGASQLLRPDLPSRAPVASRGGSDRKRRGGTEPDL